MLEDQGVQRNERDKGMGNGGKQRQKAWRGNGQRKDVKLWRALQLK